VDERGVAGRRILVFRQRTAADEQRSGDKTGHPGLKPRVAETGTCKKGDEDMTTLAPYFSETFDAQLEDLLYRICEDLQLDAQRHALAEQHYESVWKWFEAVDSCVRWYRPIIYPQGSMKLNTTVKPLKGDEYDLDFVCELNPDPHWAHDPVAALRLIERRLREHKVYASILEPKNRCVRLSYAHEFHMDILPACRDGASGGTCVVVPDREMQEWKPSNPRGYAKWFEERAGLRRPARAKVLAKAEPLPDQQAVSEKPPLRLAVQLLKRWRDIRYAGNWDLAPISIVLTTLAAAHYAGEGTVAEALTAILSGITADVRIAIPRMIVWNPSNPLEDLSERWDSNPGAYRAFVEGIDQFHRAWQALVASRGIPDLSRGLEGLFGEELSRGVIEKRTRDIQAARRKGGLGVRQTGAVTLLGAGTRPIHPNTFYGEG
jgi:Second Messenger Oligonucleotide or Dinucleotide Synthetase domain